MRQTADAVTDVVSHIERMRKREGGLGAAATNLYPKKINRMSADKTTLRQHTPMKLDTSRDLIFYHVYKLPLIIHVKHHLWPLHILDQGSHKLVCILFSQTKSGAPL